MRWKRPTTSERSAAFEFLPKGDPHVHGLKTGTGFITGLMLQWQDGKQVNMWPADLANGKLEFPSFVKFASGK